MNNIIQNFLKILIPCLFLTLGISIFCYPMFLNFDNLAGDYFDARYINYVLEHGFLWLNQVEPHQNFWDMPIFYPNKNTLAFGDVMLGAMIFYSPIRFFIKNPLTCFQVFYVLALMLNFLSFYFLSKKVFKLNNLYSSFAAYFFTFCLIRHAQTIHFQLFWQFYMVLSIFCFCLIKNSNTKLKNRLLFLSGVVFLVLQTYTTFYFGWYMFFCLPIAIVTFLLFKNTREILKNWFRNIDKFCYGAVIFGIILLLPLTYHYLLVGSKFAKAEPSSVFHLLFSNSFLNSLFVDYSYFYFPEAMLGVGLITSLLIIIALFKSKYKFSVLFFMVVLISAYCSKHIYSFLYDNFLPMAAIRALGRYVFVLVPIYSIVLAYFLKNQKSFLISLILMILVIVEQIPNINYFNWTKTGHQQRINRFYGGESCKAVYYKFEENQEYFANNIDVMFYALSKNKYSINGYSGVILDYDESVMDKSCELKIK